MPQPLDPSAAPQPLAPPEVPPAPDTELVRRLRELVTAPEHGRDRSRPATGPGWVPPAPLGTPPRVLAVPGFLRAARWRADRRAVLALLAVALAAGLVFAARVALATDQGAPVVVDTDRSGRPGRLGSPAGPPSAGSPSASAAAPTGAGAPAALHVHVVGQVARPGVLTLGAGSRVTDAVTGAGGALPSADLQRVNLARVLADGEQIHVPAAGEASPPAAASSTSAAAAALVDLNTADVAALDALPGVGPVLAQRIVDWRTAHGRFSTVEELGEVSGIGDKMLAQVRPKVTVGGAPAR